MDSFNSQKELNRSVQGQYPFLRLQLHTNHLSLEVAALLNCPRKCLGLRATAKGTIAGCINLKAQGQWIDCSKLGSTGMLIPGDVDEISEIASTARYIVLVEKDAVFQRLNEDRIFDVVPLIIVTARTSYAYFIFELIANSIGGMPDVATRYGGELTYCATHRYLGC